MVFTSKQEYDQRRLAKLNEEPMIQVNKSRVSMEMIRRVRSLNAAGMSLKKIGLDVGLMAPDISKILSMDPPPREERVR